MPTTLTLKNIPDALYERLKASVDRKLLRAFPKRVIPLSAG